MTYRRPKEAPDDDLLEELEKELEATSPVRGNLVITTCMLTCYHHPTCIKRRIIYSVTIYVTIKVKTLLSAGSPPTLPKISGSMR